MSKAYFVVIICCLLLFSCASTKREARPKQIEKYLKQSFYKNQFTGFKLFDPESQKTIKSLNASKFFIPASNTKIVTLFTALKSLDDSITGLKYLHQNDTLYIKGTGDPSLLHPYFKDSTVIKFLRSTNTPIVLQVGQFQDNTYGAGWAWEDFDTYFSPEKSAIPINGNVLTINKKSDTITIYPSLFKKDITYKKSSFRRDRHKNIFNTLVSENDTIQIPFITSDSLTAVLLSAEIGKQLIISDSIKKGEYQTLKTVKTDSLLSRMMIESDNFIAEQLLILSADKLFDTLSGKMARNHIIQNNGHLFIEKPRWVDGSGLSRYNLFSPDHFVKVLDELYSTVDHSRLFDLFPKAGVNGTLKSYLIHEKEPFIIAKSGAMGNTYNLSGYLKTKTGKVLIFSFMNNHFQHPTNSVRKKLYQLLKAIRDEY